MNVWVVTWDDAPMEIYGKEGWDIEDILFHKDRFYAERLADLGVRLPEGVVESFSAPGWVSMVSSRVQ